MNNSNIERSAQSLTPGVEVVLYELDLTGIVSATTGVAGDLYRFCSSAEMGTNQVLFGGNAYTPIGIETDGFEVSGKGRLPTPRIKISNIDLWGSAIIASLGEPVGAKVTRYITFDRYLDTVSDPDPEAVFLPQIFTIERKVSQNRDYVEFELSAAIDQSGRMLPKRQILRDYCTHIYRRWDATTNSFDYSKATCPYIGSNYYNSQDAAVSSAAEDGCGKLISSCKLRFPGLPLPTRAFPGVGRIRTR